MVGRWSVRSRALRGGWRRVLLFALPLGLSLSTAAEATIRAGDIQISGNLQSQELFRIQQGSDTFTSFDPVQQRNTFRLQYEHTIVKDGGKFLQNMGTIPFIRSANLFAYYRFVYDSIFDIAPGPFLEAQDGSPGGKIGDIPRPHRQDVAFENVLREVFVDIDLRDLPLSFRIGRQQIVWGEALSFRALDSVNGLDVTWHLQQEAGLLGKVGFDELRIPAWTFKALWDVGTVGPMSNTYVEAWDIPFDFQPDHIKFLPSPWSVPLRNPFRGGLNIPVEGTGGLQPCFDLTGNSQPNAQANPDFSNTAATGLCPSRGLKQTKLLEGAYDKRDPSDVNQFGIRIGANAFTVGFTLNYMYRRHLGAGVPGAAASKGQNGALNSNLPGFLEIAPHTTTDPITRQTSSPIGYVRVPAEFYYPYVHVVGASANYFDEFTSAVYTAEIAYTHNLPITTANPFGNGQKKKEVLLGAVNFDRPTWIRFLNPRSTILIIGQMDYNLILGHDDIKVGPSPFIQDQGNDIILDGDVGAPPTCAVPELFRSDCDLDELRQFEWLTILAATTFYWGGSLGPLVAFIADWGNTPSMQFVASVDYLPTPNIILTPAIRVWTNFGRTVDEPWGIGRLSQWDELQLKFTYQF